MVQLYNLARMTTATTGDGLVTLTGAVSSFLTFDEAGAQNGDQLSYAIDDGNNREVGRGVYDNTGPITLTRNVLRSTNNDQPINLSGRAQVSITVVVEDLRDLDGTGRFLPLTGGTVSGDLNVSGSIIGGGGRVNAVSITVTRPANPVGGQLWFDGESGGLFVWVTDANAWVQC